MEFDELIAILLGTTRYRFDDVQFHGTSMFPDNSSARSLVLSTVDLSFSMSNANE